jgi:hypothetical protein
MGHPVIWWMPISLLVVLWRLPYIPVTELIVFGAPGVLEPFVLIASVIDNQVHQKLHITFMAALYQSLHVLDCAILVCTRLVIRDVIAHIDLRRLVGWTEPDNIYSKLLNVIELGDDSRYVSNAIVVRIFKRSRINLVD